MIKFLGVVFIVIVFEAILLLIDGSINNGFLGKFMGIESLVLMGTFLALNIATTTFILSNLSSIELQEKKELFSNTRKEIKDNIFLMLILFTLHLILSTAVPITEVIQNNIHITLILKILNLFIFLLFLAPVFEMTQAVFVFENYIKSLNKKS